MFSVWKSISSCIYDWRALLNVCYSPVKIKITNGSRLGFWFKEHTGLLEFTQKRQHHRGDRVGGGQRSVAERSGVISAHLDLRLPGFILFYQALSILDVRPTIRVRLLEGHINEKALKVIRNFHLSIQQCRLNFQSFFQCVLEAVTQSGSRFGNPSLP